VGIILLARNPEIRMTSAQLMLEKEKQHLALNVRSSAEQLNALLCDGFREFGASGKITDRAETVTSVTNSTEATDYKIDEYQIVHLGADHILATYRLQEQRGELVRMTLRSTVWKLVEGKWRMLFHQGTKQAE